MDDTPQLPQGVYSEGVQSCRRGLPRKDCPYPPGADERGAWLAGWDQTARKDAADADAN
jgi:ribosome modulation factor